MSNSIPTWTKIAAAVIALGGAAGGIYYVSRQAPMLPAKPAPIANAESPSAAAVKYPVPAAGPQSDEAAAVALPELYDSDPSAVSDLLTLFNDDAIAAAVKPEFLIPRIVATVDNLPRQKLNGNALPVKPVPGSFAVDVKGNEVFIADVNAARYDAYIAAFANADVEQMLTLYRRWYPLFQQAYRELGDPDVYFNDRLVEVIDHLLQAPDAPPPIALVKPASHWEYANSDLQAASIGHRLLFRIGPVHAGRVKEKLAELRAGLTDFVDPR